MRSVVHLSLAILAVFISPIFAHDKPSPVKVTGVFEAVQSAELSADTEQLSALEIEKIVPHGTSVKKGQVVISFSTYSIDEKIKKAQTALTLAKLAMDEAELDHSIAMTTNKLDLAAAERAFSAARQAHDNYVRVDHDRSIASTHFNLKSSEASLQNALEELKQLEQMYKEDELTEESEEIVLKRAKRSVESAQFRLEGAKTSAERSLKQSIPRAAKTADDTFARAELTWKKASHTLAAARRRAEIEIAQKRDDYQKQVDDFAKMQAERKGLVVKAPHDGILYHGTLTRGRMSEKATTLKKGSAVTGKQKLATVVNPARQRVLVDLTEADRGKVAVGQTCDIHSAAYGLTLKGRLTAVADIPYANNKFSAVVNVQGNASKVAPGTSASLSISGE